LVYDMADRACLSAGLTLPSISVAGGASADLLPNLQDPESPVTDVNNPPAHLR
jgi:hypothetical protein